jgi:hypothetical protein
MTPGKEISRAEALEISRHTLLTAEKERLLQPIDEMTPAEKQRADRLQERLKQIEDCYAKWHHLGKDTNADILWQAIKQAQEVK